MVALTINWAKVGLCTLVAACLLFVAGLCAISVTVGAVLGYALLCIGARALAALVFGLGLAPMAAAIVLAAAFWDDHRQERMRAVFGRLGL